MKNLYIILIILSINSTVFSQVDDITKCKLTWVQSFITNTVQLFIPPGERDSCDTEIRFIHVISMKNVSNKTINVSLRDSFCQNYNGQQSRLIRYSEYKNPFPKKVSLKANDSLFFLLCSKIIFTTRLNKWENTHKEELKKLDSLLNTSTKLFYKNRNSIITIHKVDTLKAYPKEIKPILTRKGKVIPQ